MNRPTALGTLATRLRAASGATALALLLTALALLLTAGAAHAGAWSWSITPYAWATGVGVDAKLDGRQVIEKDISVGDLLQDLETIFQMRLEAQNGSFGAMLDVFDVTLSDEVKGIALPQGAGQADLSSDAGMTIFDFAGLYDPNGDRQGVSFLAGTRILNERATVDAMFQPAPGVSVAQQYDTNETLVDGLAGVRFSKRFSRRWGMQMQADVSTGGTDYTWSIGPSLIYAFGSTGRYALSAGYRRMTVDFKDEGGLDTQMTLSGLLVGLRSSF